MKIQILKAFNAPNGTVVTFTKSVIWYAAKGITVASFAVRLNGIPQVISPGNPQRALCFYRRAIHLISAQTGGTKK